MWGIRRDRSNTRRSARGLLLWALSMSGLLVVGQWISAAVAGPKSDPQALRAVQEIVTFFQEGASRNDLSPQSVTEKLEELDRLLPRLSPRSRARNALLAGTHLLRSEEHLLVMTERRPSRASSSRRALSLGESRLLDGISLAKTLEQSCLEAFGHRLLIAHFIEEQARDLDQAQALLESAEAASLDCDTGSQEEKEPTLWEARAQLASLWADFSREDGDRLGQLEALTATLALADPESDLAQANLLRLLELRQDLGDVTFGVEAYEPFADSNSWNTRSNARICQASLALDRRQPEQALVALRLLEQDPELSDDPAIHSMLLAYRARALLAVKPPDLEGAQAALEQAHTWSRNDYLMDRQAGTLGQIGGEVALAAGQHVLAWQSFQLALDAGENEEELHWRALQGMAEVSRARGALTNTRTLYAQALKQLEAQRRIFASDFWELPYVAQVQGLYESFTELLLEDALRGPAAESSHASGADGLDPNTLRGTPDDLLTLAAKRASLSFAAALMQDDSGLHPENLRQYTALQKLVSGELVSGATLRQGLTPGQVVYLLLPLSDQVLILEVRQEATRIHPVPFGPDAWAQVEALHKAMRGSPMDAPRELSFLGERLLSPIWDGLPEEDQPTAFILLGALEKLPLPALRYGNRYLVERTSPYELPFLQADRLLPPPPAPSSRRALSITERSGLPFAQRQPEMLDALGYQTERLETPSLAQVRDALSQSPALVVFGTHAEAPRAARVVRAGNKVEFQPGIEAAILLAEGERLSATELRRQRFHGARVFLSACETRVGDALTLEHSQGALHRAVLEAQAASVLASRWKVGDRATFALLGHVLQQLPTRGMAVALARAQRSLLTGRGLELPPGARAALEDVGGAAGEPPLVAPWSWAGFTVIGRPE